MIKQNMTHFIYTQKQFIDKSDIDGVFKSIYTTITSNKKAF